MKKQLTFKTYLLSYLSLMILLASTVLTASLHLEKWSLFVCFFISSLKALVIIIFFMHAYKKRAYAFVIAGLLIFFLAVILLALADFNMRTGS